MTSSGTTFAPVDTGSYPPTTAKLARTRFQPQRNCLDALRRHLAVIQRAKSAQLATLFTGDMPTPCLAQPVDRHQIAETGAGDYVVTTGFSGGSMYSTYSGVAASIAPCPRGYRAVTRA